MILQTTDLPEMVQRRLDAEFEVVRLPQTGEARTEFLARRGREIRGIAGKGDGRVDAELLDQLPALRIVSSFSAGLDRVDVEACRKRGIAVTNTSHVLCEAVADTGLWLLMGVARRFGEGEVFVRNGSWLKGQMPWGASLKGLKVGIYGLGHIGRQMASRFAFLGCEVGYHGRNAQGVDYAWFSDLEGLAKWCDAFVIACPATPRTIGSVDADILKAVGPDGFIVNIARGAIVDEAALISALSSGTLGSAGLDVFAEEPQVPQPLLEHPKVICLPHMASATVQTRIDMGEEMIRQLHAHLAD